MTTSLLRNLRTTLLTSVEGRIAFKGIGAFYRALELGGGAEVVNPIFYVSSSPWNLYDLLERIIELNGIPLGPLFLPISSIEQKFRCRSIKKLETF